MYGLKNKQTTKKKHVLENEFGKVFADILCVFVRNVRGIFKTFTYLFVCLLTYVFI